MREPVRLNQIREFIDTQGRRLQYLIISIASDGMVTIKWLRNKRVERYTEASILKDKVLSKLEVELL